MRRFHCSTMIVAGAMLAAVAVFLSRDVDDRGVRPVRSLSRRAPAARTGPVARDSRPVIQVGQAAYATSAECQQCHPQHYASWRQSYHCTMTQWATPEAVVAPFGEALQSRGRSYQLERRGDEFWVTMLEPHLDAQAEDQKWDFDVIRSLPREPQRVVLTTGSHVAQTYWVDSPMGLRQVPWVYHIEEQQWIPNEDSFLIPPARRLFNHWNSNCIRCHTVNPRPGDAALGFETRVAELGVACGACHGPGQAHIRLHEDANRAAADELTGGDPIANPSRLSHRQASHICGQCHSSHRVLDPVDWSRYGSRFRPGDDLESHVILHRPGTPETAEDYADGFWGDGACRTAGDELLGLVDSACYLRGELSCLSCHSMHGYASSIDQIKPGLDGNLACLQCHKSLSERLEEHTHHAAGSSGSVCFNCHMPHISYGLFKAIRSHRVDSPSAAISARTGRPNACNLCHLDKTLAWTAEKLSSWYSQPPAKLSDEESSISHAALLALCGDAAQRVIAAWHMSWGPALDASGGDWQAAYLARLLDDPYSAIRYVSYRSLKKTSGFNDFTYDFLAGPTERRRARDRALAQWRKQDETAPRIPRTEILLDAAGQLQSERAAELERQRVDRTIVIPE